MKNSVDTTIIEYRQAVTADIEQMVALLENLFAIEEDFNFNKSLQQRGLQLLLKTESAMIFVARAGTEIVGMITGQLLVSTAEGSHSLVVEDLVVKEDFRGNGIGAKLLNKISQWSSSRNANRMQLLADFKNTRAIDFYLKNKWQQTQLVCLRNYSMGA